MPPGEEAEEESPSDIGEDEGKSRKRSSFAMAEAPPETEITSVTSFDISHFDENDRDDFCQPI